MIRALLLLLAFLTGAQAAPVGTQRALLSGQCPIVIQVAGVCPSGPSVDFTSGTYWNGTGVVSNPFTVTRAGTANVDDLAGNWVAVPANTLRRSNKGALIEENRTNSIRTNSMQGAVAGVLGSGGALPNNWVNNNSGGLAVTIGTPTTINGVDVIPIQWSGITTGTFAVLSFENTTQIVASPGQVWVESFFAQLAAGSLTNISSITNNLRWTGATSPTQAFTPDNTFQRPNMVATAPASTTAVQPAIVLNFSSGVAVNITLNLGWPQVELGNSVSSPIRTTVAAVTRNADIISAPITVGNAVSMYFEGIVPPLVSTNAKAVGGITDGVGSVVNSVWPYFVAATGTTYVSLRVINANAGVESGQIAGLTTGGPFKSAFAFTNGDSQGAMNGALQTAGTQTFPTGLTTLMIGQVNGRQINSYLTRLAVWPNTRLPNAFLTSATAN